MNNTTSPTRPTQAERLADDLLVGARAIADETGFSENKVYYLHKTKRWPIGKMGKTLIASRAKLRSTAQRITAGKTPAAAAADAAETSDT